MQSSKALDVVAKGMATSVWVLQGRANPHCPTASPARAMATGPLPVGLNSYSSHGDSSRSIVYAGQGIAENNTNCSCRCILERAGAPSCVS